MRKFSFIIFTLCATGMFSQEFHSKWSHAVAGGASYCMDQYVVSGQITSAIKYKTPGYVLFYRLVQSTPRGFNCVSINANYRSGTVNTTNTGTNSSYKISGDMNWCRLDLNFTHLVYVGKNGDFAFGPGVYAGGVVFAGGNTKLEEINSAGNSETYDINAHDVLNKTHLGFNIEIQQKIDISESGAFILGLRIGLESPDGFSIPKFSKLASGYIGYQFCKKKKPKPEEKPEMDR